ncbi:cytochrome c oxidase subunit II [Leptospira sp. GIMC2001]|nr:cytochrome c oxidase subunit II [Leptospira sp. GIMC2001]WCL51378.1 cytochrome c oxidase subunit II [Leptospira sp. GIMC2001]
MPVAGTDIAVEVDTFYAFLLWASLVSFIILIGGMTWFLVRYKRVSEDQKSAYITHNNLAEFLWSFIPLVILLVIFYWGWVLFEKLRTPPEMVSEEIHVTAMQWAWEYKYKNGKTINSLSKESLNVPVGKPVKIILTSKDVIHSFSIPAFRVKQDAIPGRFTEIWFEAKEVGNYIVFCTEYCGTSHSNMMIRLNVMEPEAYVAWYHGEESVGSESLADVGKKLYLNKACASCHSVDGSRIVGPTFKGLYGQNREFESGASVKADENYLKESILQSGAKIVKGYAPAMPVYQGQLEEDEVEALIEYIKSVQ